MNLPPPPPFNDLLPLALLPARLGLAKLAYGDTTDYEKVAAAKVHAWIGQGQ